MVFVSADKLKPGDCIIPWSSRRACIKHVISKRVWRENLGVWQTHELVFNITEEWGCSGMWLRNLLKFNFRP